jgi:hypothetical protein
MMRPYIGGREATTIVPLAQTTCTPRGVTATPTVA